MLMQKSTELNIELNTKDYNGWTAFHWACRNGHSKIAEMLIQKSTELNIELDSKDNMGLTAFQQVATVVTQK